jgi:quercetin dioxygenase-like cupin family protein
MPAYEVSMAKITLNPSESFKHIHPTVSYTTLIKGKGILKIRDKKIPMKPGKKNKIPAGITHTIINEGTTLLSVNCLHLGDEA